MAGGVSHALPELDSRCENWGRWARIGNGAPKCSRMGLQPAPFEWNDEWGDPYERPPERDEPDVNDPDAVTIDRAVARLAERHKRALRDFYVDFRFVPIGIYYQAMRALDDRLAGRYHEPKGAAA